MYIIAFEAIKQNGCNNSNLFLFFLSNNFSDFQKLEREARICRKLQHPNIGEFFNLLHFNLTIEILIFFLRRKICMKKRDKYFYEMEIYCRIVSRVKIFRKFSIVSFYSGKKEKPYFK
jgi:hypothetical protein